MGEIMKKRNIIFISIISVILIIVCTITGTYAVIINVINEDGVDKIVNEINIRDLLTNDDGTYNETYYNVVNELNITEEEASLLMESKPLNDTLDIILESVVEYKLHDNINAKFSNDELYTMIVEAVDNTDTISEELKNKVIEKGSYYRKDIADYVYDIEAVYLGEI